KSLQPLPPGPTLATFSRSLAPKTRDQLSAGNAAAVPATATVFKKWRRVERDIISLLLTAGSPNSQAGKPGQDVAVCRAGAAIATLRLSPQGIGRPARGGR